MACCIRRAIGRLAEHDIDESPGQVGAAEPWRPDARRAWAKPEGTGGSPCSTPTSEICRNAPLDAASDEPLTALTCCPKRGDPSVQSKGAESCHAHSAPTSGSHHPWLCMRRGSELFTPAAERAQHRETLRRRCSCPDRCACVMSLTVQALLRIVPPFVR